MEHDYLRWHPDHALFRWVSGSGVKEGNVFYFEERVAGKLLCHCSSGGWCLSLGDYVTVTGPPTGRPPPEGVNVGYAPRLLPQLS